MIVMCCEIQHNLMVVFVVTNELHGREIAHDISSDAPIILVKKRETIIGFESVRVVFYFDDTFFHIWKNGWEWDFRFLCGEILLCAVALHIKCDQLQLTGVRCAVVLC